MNIPEEAVEVALAALKDHVDADECCARAALEAAAPYIAAKEPGVSNPDVGPRCPACRMGLVTHEPKDPHCIDHREQEEK